MHRELKYSIIDYNEKDNEYIDDLCTFLDAKQDDIVKFFGIDDFGKKANIKIFDDLDEFREKCKVYMQRDNVPLWLCGLSYNEKSIAVLSLSEYVKTKGHGNGSIDDIKKLILHEFTHSCHNIVNPNNKIKWIKEGLATSLTHQYDESPLTFDCNLEDVLFGNTDYKNYYSMFSYVYNEYGHDYMMNLIKDEDLAEKETTRLFQETMDHYNDDKRNRL